MVIVPLRLVVFGLAAKSKPTVPLPLPLAPLVIVIHDVAVLAVHAQPVATVTPTVADPASDATDWLDGFSVAIHEPACETENDWLAIVNVPVLAAPALPWVSAAALDATRTMGTSRRTRAVIHFPRCFSKNRAISSNASFVSGAFASRMYCACDCAS